MLAPCLGSCHARELTPRQICAVLGYSTVAIIFQRTKRRSKNTSWLGCFVFFDVLFCAITLGIITLLARAGLPVHCKGMTEEWCQYPFIHPRYPFAAPDRYSSQLDR